MARTQSSGREAAGEQEIGAVLEAERRAVEAVARCQRDAEEIVAAARIASLDIDRRTDRRLSRLRGRVEQQLEAELARLRAQTERVRCQPVEQDARSGRLESAVARLAARLAGGEG
jgi:hypothetical protein